MQQYSWDSVDYESAGQYLYSFQQFSLSGPPLPWAGELVLGKGSQEGQVSFALTAAWYGDEADASSAVQPFLDMMPTPDSTQFSGGGTYIGSVSALAGGSGNLNTSQAADTSDTFYVKSLMTPESDPMTLEACTAFMEYLGNEGFTADTVCIYFRSILLSLSFLFY